MPSAEILTIGTEILLGEIVDTNARHIARVLRAEGVDVFWTASVGDNPERIAWLLRQALARSEIVIATGGLGPTVDDVTREAVALALGVELEFRPALWDEVQAMFRSFGREPSANNRRQAFVPAGALAVSNPVGTAPAFICETERAAVLCLPGVPREMEYLLTQAVLPYLRERFGLSEVIVVRVLHTIGVGESLIDERIADLELLANPTVGLAAHAGQVDVRITAKAGSTVQAEALLAPVEAELRSRLGDMVYGADQASLEEAAVAPLRARGWRLVVVEAGLEGALVRSIAAAGADLAAGLVLPAGPDAATWAGVMEAVLRDHPADVTLAVALLPDEGPRAASLRLRLPGLDETTIHRFGGHPRLDARRATHLALDALRRLGTT
jgi:competence/damage-inducible protein CinA-like protein